MKAVVIYQSTFGNTHAIADAIGAGLKDGNEVLVAPAARVSSDTVADADLVVVGGPTHLHGMSGPSTRKSAALAAKPASTVALEENADSSGLNEWFASLGTVRVLAAAFDTRQAGIAALTGRASSGIQRQLLRHGFSVVDLPHSFLVTGDNTLRPGEAERAHLWGQHLAGRLRGALSAHAEHGHG